MSAAAAAGSDDSADLSTFLAQMAANPELTRDEAIANALRELKSAPERKSEKDIPRGTGTDLDQDLLQQQQSGNTTAAAAELPVDLQALMQPNRGQDTSHSSSASKRPNVVSPLDSQKPAAAAASSSSFDESQDTSHSSRASKRRKVHHSSSQEETTGTTKNNNHTSEPALLLRDTAVLTAPSSSSLPPKLSPQQLATRFHQEQQKKSPQPQPQPQLLVRQLRGPPKSLEQAHSRDDNEDDDDPHLQRRRSAAPVILGPTIPKESDAIPLDDDNVSFWDAAPESVPEHLPTTTTTLWKKKKLAVIFLVVLPVVKAAVLSASPVVWAWWHKSLESSRPAWQEFWFIICTVRLVLSGLLGILVKYLWNSLVSAPVQTTWLVGGGSLVVWWIVRMRRRNRAKRQRDLDVGKLRHRSIHKPQQLQHHRNPLNNADATAILSLEANGKIDAEYAIGFRELFEAPQKLATTPKKQLKKKGLNNRAGLESKRKIPKEIWKKEGYVWWLRNGKPSLEEYRATNANG